MYPGPHFEGFWAWWAPVGSETAWSTLVKLGQPWSNLVKFRETCPRSRLEVILMRRVRIGSGWVGSGYLVLRADIRENPEGKNRVMTAVYWH
jgi:hypothetical protein